MTNSAMQALEEVPQASAPRADSERVVQLLGTLADIVVPVKAVEEMGQYERIRWAVRRTTLITSLVDHMIDSLHSWEPPE